MHDHGDEDEEIGPAIGIDADEADIGYDDGEDGEEMGWNVSRQPEEANDEDEGGDDDHHDTDDEEGMYGGYPDEGMLF
jgi:hypothetical protein